MQRRECIRRCKSDVCFLPAPLCEHACIHVLSSLRVGASCVVPCRSGQAEFSVRNLLARRLLHYSAVASRHLSQPKLARCVSLSHIACTCSRFTLDIKFRFTTSGRHSWQYRAVKCTHDIYKQSLENVDIDFSRLRMFCKYKIVEHPLSPLSVWFCADALSVSSAPRRVFRDTPTIDRALITMPADRDCAVLMTIFIRHGTGSHCDPATQWPGNPATRRPSWPGDPVL